MRNIFTEDFAQKRRNRAIGITDVAITKVPKTNIFGFSNEQNLYIQKLHKELLCRVQKLNDLYHTNRMEVGILLDIHTWDYWVIDGKKECAVDFKDSFEVFQVLTSARKNQLMMMHPYMYWLKQRISIRKSFLNMRELHRSTMKWDINKIMERWQ